MIAAPLIRVLRRGPHYVVGMHTSTGDTSYVDPLADALPPDCGVLAVSSRGLPLAEVPETVGELAARYEQPLLDAIGDAPFVVGGFGFGGLVAMAMALAGRPRALFAIETKIPDPAWRSRPDDLETLAPILAVHHAKWSGRAEAAVASTGTPVERFVAALEALGTPMDPADAEHELRLFQKHVKAVHTAAFTPTPLPALIVKVAGEHPPLGWEPLAPNMRTLIVPGDHYTAARRENAPAIAAALTELLATV